MKTKEELQEDARFVRQIESWAHAKPENDTERQFIASLFKRGITELDKFIMPHVCRISEALAEMDYPSAEAVALRAAVMRRIGTHYKLRDYRNVKVPALSPAKAS